MKTSLRFALASTGLLAACAASLAQTRTFTSQYSFGDSLSDNGNLFALSGRALPPPPYVNGRFSNGPTFVELLGNATVPAATVSARRGDLNFAFGGATAAAGGTVPSLAQQVGLYTQLGLPARPTDLFTVLIGANDLIPVLGAPTTPTNPANLDTAGATAARNAATGVQALIAAGARNLVVGGMPNLGLTPRALAAGGPGGPGSTFGTRASVAFNNELRARLGELAGAAPDLNIVYLDLQGVIERVTQEFGALGFNNATSFALAPAAQGGGAGNPAGYVFFDDIHPTAATHALLAAIVVEQLNPERPLGFAATAGTAALALQGLGARALDDRVSELATGNRAAGRGEAYAMFNYGDGIRAADGPRPRFGYEAQVLTAGADWRRGDAWFGGAVNLGRLDASLRGNRGEFEIEDAGGRLYGVWRGGPMALTLEGSYGVLRVNDIRRTTAFGGFRTNGKTSGTHWGFGGKATWLVEGFGVALRPWLGLRTDRVELDPFTERDVPALAMTFEQQEAKSTAGSIGLDFGSMRKLAARDLLLDFRVAWHDEIGDKTRGVAGRLADNFTRTTTLAVEDGDGSGLELGAAATLFCSKKCSVSLGYTADIRSSEKVASRVMLSVQTGF